MIKFILKLNSIKTIWVLFVALLLTFLSPDKVTAQQHNKWYFGNGAGLDFTTYPPKGISSSFPLFDQAIANICNDSGELIFYTNGRNVYNKNGIIQNGDGLLGDSNISTCTLIVPVPGIKNKWYILYSNTNRFFHTGSISYYYAIVIINNGLPQVIEKNIEILKNKKVVPYVAGKIGYYELPNQNKTKIFVDLRDSLACLDLNSNGLDTINIVYSLLNPNNPQYIDTLATLIPMGGLGQMTISHNGKWLAIGRSANDVNYYRNPWNVYLYEMEIESGAIKKYYNIQKYTSYVRKNSDYLENVPYMFQFSPNDSFLYISYFNNYNGFSRVFYATPKFSAIPFNTNARLTQLDLFALNTDTALKVISNNTRYIIPMGDTSGCDLGPGMAFGPDGKLYLSGGPEIDPKNKNKYIAHHMSVIEFPDKKYPACNFKCWAIDLPGEPWYVLPQFQYVPERINYGYLNNQCHDSVTLFNKSDALYKSIKWIYNNGIDSIIGDTVRLPILKSGYLKFTMEAKSEKGFKRTKKDSVLVFTNPKVKIGLTDSVGCQYLAFQFLDSSITDTIQLKLINNQWVKNQKWWWSFGDTKIDSVKSPMHVYTKNGIYPIQLKYSNGFCIDSALIINKVNILSAPKPGFTINDTIGCIPFQLMIKDKSIGVVKKYAYFLNESIFDSIPSPSIQIQKSGEFELKQELLGQTGCITKDSLKLLLHEGIGVNFKPTINSVSVNFGDTSILATWPKTNNALSYDLNYKKSNSSKYESTLISDTFFIHIPVDASNYSYQYKLKLIDSCGNASQWSNEHQSILFTGSNMNNEKALLSWGEYFGWKPINYEIFSYLPPNLSPIFIANEVTLNFEDITFNENAGFKKCYFIKAISNQNIYTSYSNTKCIPFKSIYFFPNAFTPNHDGLNDNFTPVTNFTSNYSFKVFNRWGIEVFQTNQPNNGWDGTYNNEFQPSDVYFYILSFSDENNSEKTLKGSFTLVR